MLTVEELRKKHEQEMADLLACQKVASSMPEAPKQTLFGTKRVPWTTYEVKDLKEAYGLAGKFEWYPYAIAKDGCFTYLQPVKCIDESKMKEVRHVPEGTPYLELHTIDRRPHDAELVFYTKTEDKIVRVSIRFRQCPWAIHIVTFGPHGDGHNRYRESRKDYPRIGEDRILHWNSENLSGRATYHWFTDAAYDATMLPAIGE